MMGRDEKNYKYMQIRWTFNAWMQIGKSIFPFNGYLHPCVCMCVCTWMQCPKRLKEGTGSTGVADSVWVPGNKLQSSARAVSALNGCTFSPVPSNLWIGTLDYGLYHHILLSFYWGLLTCFFSFGLIKWLMFIDGFKHTHICAKCFALNYKSIADSEHLTMSVGRRMPA